MQKVQVKRFLVSLVAVLSAAVSARTVELGSGTSSCTVDLDGARVVSYRVDGQEVLWNDDPPQKSAADWAHGGIPVCWPHFGVAPDGKIHGTAWRRTFSLRSLTEDASRSELLLGLEEGDARLEYRIVLADVLTLEMTTTNAGGSPLRCSFGFHPYFLVSERDRCRVEGVDGLPFEDDPSVLGPEKGVWRGVVPLTGAIDRIFALPDTGRHVFPLSDPVRARVTVVGCEGATHVNVWNPGEAKRCPGTVPGDSWRRFACVEPITVGGASSPAVTIPPGGKRTLKMTVAVKEEKEKR